MKKILITIVLGIFLLANVAAFAVSSEYWDQNPIVMNPGETKEVFLTLQNMAGDESIDAQGLVIEGKEIFKLTEGAKIHTVPNGEKLKIYLELTVPKDTPEGKYTGVISFKTSKVGTGDFNFGSSVEREIPVLVQAQEKQKTSGLSYWIIGILAVALIVAIIFIFRLKNKRRK